MAITSQYVLNRNASQEDTTTYTYFRVDVIGYDEQTGEFSYASTPEGGLPSVDTLEWSNSGYVFKEWNTIRDGSGTSFAVGDYPPVSGSYDSGWNIFAIWEEPTPEPDPDPDPDPETTKYLVDAADLTSVANAIRAKNKTTFSLSFPDEFVDAIESFSESPRGVQFIDYDGTLLYSYTPEEFSQLTELPPNPTHEGLTAQGWNWTLAEINTQLLAVPEEPVWVGQLYVTSDGKSRIYIHLADELLCSMRLCFAVNGTVEIDWGDETEATTVVGTSISSAIFSGVHTYSSIGDYVICIKVLSGEMTFRGTDGAPGTVVHPTLITVSHYQYPYSALITKVEIGSNVTGIGQYAFQYCQNLKFVTMSNSVTEVGKYVFNLNYSLLSVTLPRGLEILYTYVFASCYSLLSVSIPSSALEFKSYAFSNCRSLKSITVPSGATTMGTYAFSNCKKLLRVTLPSGVTTISSFLFNACVALERVRLLGNSLIVDTSAFNGCASLSEIIGISKATSIGGSAFYECAALKSIEVSTGVESVFSSTFYGCYTLSSVSLPSTVKSINATAFEWCCSLSSIILPSGLLSIADGAFRGCYILTKITIPSTVTSIGARSFQHTNLYEIHFKGSTPPVASGGFFYSVPTSCIIYVPYSEDHSVLNAYKTAANYPNPNTYTYVEE